MKLKDLQLVESLLNTEYKLGVYDTVKNKILYFSEQYALEFRGDVVRIESRYVEASNLTTPIKEKSKTELMKQVEFLLKDFITEERNK